jgi:hypothetical protein
MDSIVSDMEALVGHDVDVEPLESHQNGSRVGISSRRLLTRVLNIGRSTSSREWMITRLEYDNGEGCADVTHSKGTGMGIRDRYPRFLGR